MLGFSPIGSTPLGGSDSIEYSLSANSITTSSPSLQSSSILQVHSVASDSISMGQPTVDTSDLVHNIVLTPSSINTNQPVVNSTLLSKFDNRVVDINSRRLGTSVKFDDNNSAVVEGNNRVVIKDNNNVVINYSNNKVKVG